MYIASTLGFDTIFFYPGNSNSITMPLSVNDHVGQWTFNVRNCVDRFDQFYGALDCDPGLYNTFTIEITVIKSCTWGPFMSVFETHEEIIQITESE